MILKNMILLQGDVHELQIEPGGSAALIAENGLDVLATVLRRENEQTPEIIVNDQVDGTWGEERRLQLPNSEGPVGKSVWFKFNGLGLEIWTTVFADLFSRFDEKACQRIRFVRTHRIYNPRNTLVSGMNSIDYTANEIEAHLIYRRMDALERQIARGISSDVDAGKK